MTSQRPLRMSHVADSPRGPGRGAAPPPPPAPPVQFGAALGDGGDSKPCLPGRRQTGGSCRGFRARNTEEGGTPKATNGRLCSLNLSALPLGSLVAHFAAGAQGRRRSLKASVAGDASPRLLHNNAAGGGRWSPNPGAGAPGGAAGRAPTSASSTASSGAPCLGNLQRGN